MRHSKSSYSTYTGTRAAISSSDSSSSSSETYATAITASSPDYSGGLQAGGYQAGYSGEAVAIGEDTLTSGSLSATLADEGAIVTVDGTVTMTAASESTTETAFATADTDAYISGGELTFRYAHEGDHSKQGPTGSTAASTSTTTVTAYDLQPYGGGDDDAGAALVGEEAGPSREPGGSHTDLDGNVAMVDFSAQAAGDDSLVLVDAFALAVEDEISISAVHADLAVD